ncbi:glycosyltransferase family 2 protein [Moraxella nasicaprae]|uniref:Glycosyltransferase family 2 protein n=1 Tax=Moraxella nasicaprae TaxID=2904122 RepID=A0ABY6F1Y0_9GAMM|nr:glycosyltransferase family 2 protein [Moraxella nasicaprae]UXZ04105.1 glycosyltransferase family 2 protein [Moraxella nasicaprae]
MLKEVNLNSLRPLDNPKESTKYFLEKDDFYQYVWALKWNYEDTTDLIQKFYARGDGRSFFKALYLIYHLDGADKAYQFIKTEGVLSDVIAADSYYMEMLILILVIYSKVGNANDIDFVLNLMNAQLTRSLPRTLGIPDIYTHASLHALIARAIRQAGDISLSNTNDLIVMDVQDGQLVLEDVSGKKIELQNNHDISIAAMMRVRNERDNIGVVIEAVYKYVDVIILYDDCSTDDTVDIVKSYQQKGINIDLIEGQEWLFNEALIHQIIVKRGREIGATHFVQLDADEIFSSALNPTVFRELMQQMQPGDVLALPWLNVNDDISGYYSEEKIVGIMPSRGLKRYKDIAFADDGFTNFGEWQYAHVNTSPFVYVRRFLSLSDEFSLIHLEQINLLNYIAKKDWYRIRAYAQNGKLPSDPYADIRLPLLQLQESISYFDNPVHCGDDHIIEIFKQLAMARIESNTQGCQMYPDIKKQMYLNYDAFIKNNTNTISEK